MKKLLITLFALLTVAQQGMAQNVKVPKWEKFVSVNRDGVNMRKGPGTNFPLLYSYEWRETTYSWKKEEGFAPFRPEAYNAVFPVIREEKGWYLVYLDKETNAYIRKDFCVTMEPLPLSMLNDDCQVIYSQIHKIKGTEDIYGTGGQSNASDYLFFGKKWGTAIVWTSYGDKGVAFVNKECGRANDDYYEDYFDNADKINVQHLNAFLKANDSGRIDYITYLFSTNSGVQTFTYSFNPLTYKHAMTTEPVAYSSASTGKNSHTTVSKNMNLSFKENAAVDEDDDLGLNGENAVKEYKAMVEKLKKAKTTSNLDLINEVVKEAQLYAEKYKDVKLTDAQKSEIEQLMKEVEDMSGNSEEDTVYEVVEQMPKFPGGDAALIQYLSSHVKYPATAEENGITGRVLCSFIVEKDGSISNVKVSKGVEASLDAEAVRVLKSMPKWIPGKQNGKTVRVKFTTPVTFRLH